MSVSVFSVLIIGCLGIQVNGALEGRVVGGDAIGRRDRDPYNSVVALATKVQNGQLVLCSGVMIHRQYVLTTGHCLASFMNTNSNVHAVVGENDIFLQDNNEQKIDIDSFKVHYGYKANTGDHNIGIIKLVRKAQLADTVQLAHRVEYDPTVAEDLEQNCQTVGWGPFADSPEARTKNSRVMRSAGVTMYGYVPTYVFARTIVQYPQPTGAVYAQAHNNRQKLCLLDLGSPVACKRNNKYTLKGLIAESNCESGSSMIVVTEVPQYQDWIDDCLEDWDNCASLQ